MSRVFQTVRRFSSALYITGDKAHNTFAVLTPYIDFEKHLNNLQDLENTVKARGLHVNVQDVAKQWRYYKNLEEQKAILEVTRSEIGVRISKLLKLENVDDSEELDKLKVHAKFVKEDLKALKEYIYGLEENVMLKILSLPNELHPNTPAHSENVLFTALPKIALKSESNLQIGLENDLLEYVNPLCCFLKNDAALFEHCVSQYFTEFLDNKSFLRFSNADFVRSVVVEGCGSDISDPFQTFVVGNGSGNELNRLHLVGGASLYSFMAYFAKNLLQKAYFPLKAYSLGRKYVPFRSVEANLIKAQQQTALDVFIAVQTEEQLQIELEQIIDCIKELYTPLGYHFKLSYLPAKELNNFESLRLSVQLFSNYLTSYVEVGHVSVSGDYLSKRLLFTGLDNKERTFPKIISGALLNVQAFLGCALEANHVTNKRLIDDVLLKYAP